MRFTILCLCLALVVPSALSASNYLLYAPYSARPCPTGWNYFEEEDTCNKVFPSVHYNRSIGVEVEFDEAVRHCAEFGAALPVIYNNQTLPQYFRSLIGERSGRSWWIGVRADKSRKLMPQKWLTATKAYRSSGFYFSWDTAQGHPSVHNCVVNAEKGDGGRILGGNGKMLTVDCTERHSAICTMPRVPPAITGIDEGPPRRIEFVYGQGAQISLVGPRIPPGTLVSLQTTEEDYFTSAPGLPTHCEKVAHLTGASTPLPLNVSDRVFHHTLCNGTCSHATVTIPPSLPLVRGYKYSFCFFVPTPWAHYDAPSEFQREMLGPAAFLEVVQRHQEYLQDLCLRRSHILDMFYGGAGITDTDRSPVEPFYFSTPVEGDLNKR